MKIYKFDYPILPVKNIFVALGTFDGLHLGHQQIIKQTVKEATQLGVKAGVLTFSPHPRSVTNGQNPPPLIVDYKEKIKLLQGYGLDFCLIQHFTPEFAKLLASDFIKYYLVDALAVKGVVIGEDFRFGSQGQGNYQTLQEAQDIYGFKTIVLKTLQKGKIDVSSSHIRSLIGLGKVDEVPAFLGRPFTLAGTVKKGDGRGRHLNYPTANIDLPAEVIKLKRGVYVAYVTIDNNEYPAVVNYGLRPTFQKQDNELEVHVLNFEGNLYGQELKISFVKYLREEEKFNDFRQLQRRIALDVEEARQILATVFLYKDASSVVK